MRILVPIKVKILPKVGGGLDYPDFQGVLQIFKDSPGYKGGKIHYDQTSGLGMDSDHSPFGVFWGIKLVDEEFARQAIEAFPDRVTVLSDEEAKDFWENRAYFSTSELSHDVEQLQSLKAEYDLKVIIGQDTVELETKIAKALDPDDSEPGVKRNLVVKWDTMKVEENITIKTDVV